MVLPCLYIIKEKILITGGAGFIGSHVVDLLVKHGYRVFVIDNLSSGLKDNVNKKAKLYIEDIRNSQEIFEKVKPDYLIHHAAQINVRESIKNPVYDAEQNILGSLALLEFCRKYGVKKVIFASSGGTVYGNPENLPARENFPLKPLSPYGIAKVAIENYLEFYHKNFGLDYIVLRYGNVYGPRQNPKGEAGVISVFIDKMMKQEISSIWGDGKQTRDFVYVKDVARANLLGLKYKGNHKIFNIGTGKENLINDVFNILKQNFNSENPTNVPYQEQIPRVCLDCSLASNELGWKSKVSLEDGIKKTIEWFKYKK